MYADTMYIPQDIHDVYRRHRTYCSTRTTFKVTHLGGGGLGAGGWVLLGPMGLVVPPSAPGADRPSKEASGDAARAAKSHFATLPTIAIGVWVRLRRTRAWCPHLQVIATYTQLRGEMMLPKQNLYLFNHVFRVLVGTSSSGVR